MPRQHGKRRLRRPSKPCYNEAAPAASRTQLNLPITARSPSRYIIYQEVVEFVVCHLLRQVDVPSRQRIPSTGARDHITWMITPWAPSTGARDPITWLITPWFPQPLSSSVLGSPVASTRWGPGTILSSLYASAVHSLGAGGALLPSLASALLSLGTFTSCRRPFATRRSPSAITSNPLANSSGGH